MGRRQRGKIYGGIYHVMNRGNRKALIYEDDRDRRRFLQILIEQKRTYGVNVFAGCELGNHFHAVVSTPHGNLSEFMAQWQGCFARYSNWRHHRVGHLFQGRFRDVLIEHDIHLLIACVTSFSTQLARVSYEDPKTTGGARTLPRLDLRLCRITSRLTGSRRCSRARLVRIAVAFPQPHGRSETGAGVSSAKRGRCRPGLAKTGHPLVRRGTVALGELPRAYRSLLRSTLPELLHEGMTASIRETLSTTHTSFTAIRWQKLRGSCICHQVR
jgi:REP element-mobilizing transposase RayT